VESIPGGSFAHSETATQLTLQTRRDPGNEGEIRFLPKKFWFRKKLPGGVISQAYRDPEDFHRPAESPDAPSPR